MTLGAFMEWQCIRLQRQLLQPYQKPRVVVAPRSDDDAPWHGTLTGYTSRKCRCVRCREAWNLWHIAYRETHPRPSRARQPELVTGSLFAGMEA